METSENISKSNTLKNILLAVFGLGALSAGYLAFNQARENYRLQDQLDQQKLNVENNEQAFSAIENNLAEASSRAGVIDNTSNESIKSTSEERIVKEIVFIDKIMNRNREIIKNLTATLGEKDRRLIKYRKSIDNLEKRMNEYKTKGNVMVAESEALKMDLLEANKQGAELQKEVADLQKGVAERDAEIDSKAQLIGTQSQELAEKEIKIHTAYYVVGTYKDLIANNVVEKKGGVIGIGSTKALKTDFDRNAFHQIDIYSNRSIPVFGGDISILTNHNTDSYELVKDDEANVQWIKVTDPDKFWESSKYLVVATKEPLYEGKITLMDPNEY